MQCTKIGCGTAVDADFILSGKCTTNCYSLSRSRSHNGRLSDLSSTQYISEIVSKAHQRANCKVRSFSSGDIHLLVRAFIVYVRPIVEYNSVIWSSVAKHDIELVEKVQRCLLNDSVDFATCHIVTD